MGEKERNIINLRLSTLAENERLFRINSGMGWAGNAVRKGDIVLIKNPYPLHAAPEGWPDLTGWTTITITPDMIGQRVAVWTGEEIKATGRLSKAQERFKEIIERMGGIFRILKP
jgi:hypothetical protein